MRQTLIHIPHQVGPLPLFGLGWMLLIWAVVAVIILVRAARSTGSKGVLEQIPFLVIVALVFWLVLPHVEETGADHRKLGLPIRGYGVMLLLGVVSGVATSAYRARKMGLDPEVIFSLAFWVFIFGIVGARLFYLVEYWDDFVDKDASLQQTLVSIVNFTEGGLVVYGSVIGGLLAGFFFLRGKRLPVLAIADITAPSMVLGLAIGRIGCLLNGCCYGGVCDEGLPCIRFPAGSPPYMQQLHEGQLLGMKLRVVGENGEEGKFLIESVEAGSLAEKNGVKSGDMFEDYYIPKPKDLQHFADSTGRKETRAAVELANEDGPSYVWSTSQLPRHSLPVHPTQIYASINGFLLFVLLWLLFPLRRKDGVVFATLITLYPIARFLEETIRSDESGQLGTALTISQWISAGLLLLAITLWWFIYRRAEFTRSF